VRTSGQVQGHNRPRTNYQEQTMTIDHSNPAAVPPETRSDNLFATDADDSGDDGRFEIAEEVSLDQQTDSSRKVGQVSDAAAAEALAESIEEKTQAGL
jgi:hypothetical protein